MRKTKNDSNKVIYLESLLNRFKFNDNLKKGFMFFVGGSILLPTYENEIELLQIASRQISEFDINEEFEEILGPLRDIVIQSFFEEYIWRLDVKIETKKIKVPGTNTEVSEFKFKNHKKLSETETKIQKFFEKEVFLNQLLECVGKELSLQGYNLTKSFEAGNCFFNLKAQSDRNCTTQLLYTINHNLTPILDWILMVARSANSVSSDKYLDIQIALTGMIHGQDKKFIELFWSFQSCIFYFEQKEIVGIPNLSIDEFHIHCREKAIYFMSITDTRHIHNVAIKRIHDENFPSLVSGVDEKQLFDSVFNDIFGESKNNDYHGNVHLKSLIIYSFFCVICETILSNNSEISLQ